MRWGASGGGAGWPSLGEAVLEAAEAAEVAEVAEAPSLPRCHRLPGLGSRSASAPLRLRVATPPPRS